MNILKEYRRKYIVRKDIDTDELSIKCKFGEISRSGKKELMYCHYKSKRKLTEITKKIRRDKGVYIIQGDIEGMIKFPENKLSEYSKILEVEKRTKKIK